MCRRPIEATAVAEDIALDIIFEDADMLVVNKPPGMTVHPSPGHTTSTLVNAILAHCTDLSGIGGVLRPGIVHRLDRDTSGVIVVAKNDAAHNALAKQLKDRTVEKTYVALVEGTPKPAEGVIDAPIARDPRNRQRMAIVDAAARPSRRTSVIERFDGTSLVEARPKTGRTHQIRVHLAAIGHPIIGDRVYGKPSQLVARQFLHARRIVFAHPRTGERVEFEAPLPADLEASAAEPCVRAARTADDRRVAAQIMIAAQRYAPVPCRLETTARRARLCVRASSRPVARRRWPTAGA